MSDQPTLVLFSVGPVQSFIASARKTEDLWGGSYLLSFLVEQTIEQLHVLVGRYGGEVELIFPAEQEVFASPKVATFPNRLLALVTMDLDRIFQVCEELTQFIYNEFEEICLFGLEDAFSGAPLDQNLMSQLTLEQARGLLEVTWALEPVGAGGYEEARQGVENRLAAVKNNRLFTLQGQEGIVCTMCGERQALHESPYEDGDSIREMRRQVRSTWDKLHDKYNRKEEREETTEGVQVFVGRIRHNEALCGVCLGKRTSRDYFTTAIGRKITPFRSTVDIAAPHNYYAIISMDGDDMGKWLAGQKGSFPESAGTIAYHRLISQRLGNFAGHAIPMLIDEAYGELVYAGGDDVLAFVPVGSALHVINQLRAAFADEEYGLHPEATASLGIVILHKRYPLNSGLEHARSMESRAKEYVHPRNKKSKDAVGMAVFTRSGERRDFVFPWMIHDRQFSINSEDNLVNLMLTVVELLLYELSPTFAQSFVTAFLPLLGAERDGKAKFQVFQDEAKNNELLATEMTRLLERSLLNPKSPVRSTLPELARDLVKVHDLMGSGWEFVNWLEAIQFFARIQKEGVTVP